MKTLEQFLADYPVKFSCKRADRNPHKPDFSGDHYACTLTAADGTRRRVYFSKGYGHNGTPPAVDEVLDCLASDSASVDQPFEHWAADYGYDPDSRKALKIYQSCKRSKDQLLALFGADGLEELLYEVERS